MGRETTFCKNETDIGSLAKPCVEKIVAEGTLVRNEANPDLCRTQQVIQLADKTLTTSYFLTHPIGNHHIIVPGHCQELIKQLLD